MKKILLFTLLPALAFGQAKISELDALTAGADADEVAIVDKSDTTQAASGSTKKITLANILAWLAGKDITWTGTNTFASVVATAANVTSLVFEGATADDNETTLAVTDPTADRTVTLPDATGTVLLEGSEEGKTESVTITIAEPDTMQGISDVVVLKHFPAEKYPNGVTMVSVHIGASAAYTSEAFNIEESASPTGSTPSTVEAITLSAATGEDDGTFTDGDIAADAYLLVDLDDTPEDVAFCTITLTYTID